MKNKINDILEILQLCALFAQRVTCITKDYSQQYRMQKINKIKRLYPSFNPKPVKLKTRNIGARTSYGPKKNPREH